MRRIIWIGMLTIVWLLASSRAAQPVPVHAEPLPEQTKQLLEKSLSIVEIDREIERIAALRGQTEQQIEESRNRLAEQEIAITVQREQASKVLRAYYMGRTDFILDALLNAKSLPELLRTWETMDYILSADRGTLDRYADQYAVLREGYASLQQDRIELAAVEQNLQAQRERLLKLQDEVGKALAASGEEARLRQMMAELETYWNNVGLYEVKRYFRALAEAMQHLPNYIQEHPETLKSKGLSAKLTLTDEQLNAFLRDRDDRFQHFSIQFEQDRMLLSGDNGDIQVQIHGHYSLQDKPENAILFHIDSLVFNGLALPDTTRADLERSFDLGFYPQKLIKYVKAKSVELSPGQLTVELGIG